MNTTLSSVESGGDKHLPETTVQSIAQNLTTMQSIQNVQSVVQSNIQNIQSTQTIVGSVGGTSTSLIGKSMSMDTNSKLPVMKPVVPCGTTSTSETNKITTTVERTFYLHLNTLFCFKVLIDIIDHGFVDLLSGLYSKDNFSRYVKYSGTSKSTTGSAIITTDTTSYKYASNLSCTTRTSCSCQYFCPKIDSGYPDC